MTATFSIEQRKISDVLPYDKNPRKISPAAVEKVANSIKEFGWQQPIVVDEKGFIIVGHTRLKAAKQLKLKVVPVHVAAGLSEAQIVAYRIADNRTGSETVFDFEMLGEEMSSLLDLEYGLEHLGFDVDELNGMGFGVSAIDLPTIASGDKSELQQITFTLHNEQCETVREALRMAKEKGLTDSNLNENSNGNALAIICEHWLVHNND